LSVFRRRLALEEETALFILVNFADIVLTGLAFRFGAAEANLLAREVLERFGLYGMVAYKFVLVTFVILVCQYIYSSHPKVARLVLIAGSVAYSILIAGVTISLFAKVLGNF